MKKITKATFKSFVKRNRDKLLVKVHSSFDGMTDGLQSHKGDFEPARSNGTYEKHTLGVQGVWLVGSSRDYFNVYEQNGLIGIGVQNCCGHFTVAIRA